MYEEFYGFSEKPFSLSPDPRFLFMSAHHRAALTLLEYAIESRSGFCVLSGEIGCGKTTLIHRLLSGLDGEVSVGVIRNTHPGFGHLLQWACMSFGLEFIGKDNAELYELFVQFLLREYSEGRRAVLIVDEAQNLDETSLEELRVLSNVNSAQDILLQTILVGQPQLKDLLKSYTLLQLTQRVSADYHLGPMTMKETEYYVWHRLRVAGGPITLFTPHAIRAMYRASGGVPRLVNQLCDMALVFAYGESQMKIDSHLMKQVVKQKEKGGVFPSKCGVSTQIAAH